MKNKIIVPILVTVVVAGGIGFYAGMQVGKGAAPASGGSVSYQGGGGQGFQGGAGGPSGAGRRGGLAGGIVTGQVLSLSGGNLTVQSRSGSSQLVILPGSAAVTKSVSGSASDITAGETVMIQGTPNSDGSITAQTVQIRPTMPSGSQATSSQPQ